MRSNNPKFKTVTIKIKYQRTQDARKKNWNKVVEANESTKRKGGQ